MKLQFVKYNSNYLKSCAQLIAETWSIDDELINASKPKYLFYYYIRNCVYNSIYTDLIIDQETERVLGILFASDENHTTYKSSLKNIKNLFILFKHIFLGHLGKRFIAFKTIRDIKKLQGQGYGRELMNRYIQFCQNQQNMKKIFLWTDISCNYKFYEHYGFRLYKQFYHDQLTEHCDQRTDKPNGFIYYKDLTLCSTEILN